MKCDHEHMIGLDKVMRCRKCGALGGKSMEELATFQSLRQARYLLERMALDGNYGITAMGTHSAIYTRSSENMEEKIYVDRKGDRKWVIAKVIESKEVM